jgi:anti-anti-sigma factor
VSIATSRRGNLSMLRLEGEIDIGVAAELKAALLATLEAGDEIRISLEHATALDVTAFQLLWAAEHEAARRGVKFAVSSEFGQPARCSLENMGLNGWVIDQAKRDIAPCEIGVLPESE